MTLLEKVQIQVNTCGSSLIRRFCPVGSSKSFMTYQCKRCGLTYSEYLNNNNTNCSDLFSLLFNTTPHQYNDQNGIDAKKSVANENFINFI
jgi:protein-arginine kinase activator protein McsA